MLVVSHRGYWKDKSEQNSIASFIRSFELGFGVETDIRDYSGKLVIAHDIAKPTSPLLSDFFRIYKQNNQNYPLALNIKADGLQNLLQELLLQFDIKNYFVFDMSIPDHFSYLKKGLRFFSRKSDLEKEVIFFEQAAGIWLDGFQKLELNENEILFQLESKKQICLVSPELHSRPHKEVWNRYKEIANKWSKPGLMICTDYPEQAKEFFHEKN